jgi:hypothetical protein
MDRQAILRYALLNTPVPGHRITTNTYTGIALNYSIEGLLLLTGTLAASRCRFRKKHIQDIKTIAD